MILSSLPTESVQYKIDLPDIGRDYFVPEQKVLENEFIATSTAPAGYFRQLVKYDLSSVKRQYSAIVSLSQALELAAMAASAQTSYRISTATGLYEAIVTINLAPIGKTKAMVNLGVSIIRQIT